MKAQIIRAISILFSISILFTGGWIFPEEEPGGRALLIIDIQDFYFKGSRPLDHPERASANAAMILKHFRESGQLVVHIRHRSSSLAEIHHSVTPQEGEKVITKEQVNAFKDTDLLEFLKNSGIERLVICGMMTHMCVEAAVRGASDFGFQTTVIGDACTTRDLQFGGRTIKAADVHFSTLASLDRYYGRVLNTDEFISAEKKIN